ncbi:SBBP repeat-containing protein [Lysobacter yangpyeongensis]|uniref:SBBP repeat-containing protein n=1 Tax=Lysobacter yangpyeongensis TaxID=346182 RepID=A0ABW0SPB0_9GAMM
MNKKFGLAALAAGIAVALWFGRGSQEAPVFSEAPVLSKAIPAAAASAEAAFSQAPMAFERNVGQTDAEVLFLARGPGYGLFLTPTEAVLSLTHASNGASTARAPAIVRMSLLGTNPRPVVEGGREQEGISNYYHGATPAEWHSNVQHYGEVRYRDVYPGIDLVYYGKQQQLEYDFVVAPGRDPARIAVQFAGIDSMRLDDKGNLLLRTASGDLVQHKPVLYQEVDGQRRPVQGAYRLLGGNRVGFEVARYDATRPLVIDPVVGYATYFGGGADDGIAGLATDAAGNLYAIGTTTSVNFPLKNGAQTANRGADEVFVSKFNADGNALVYSTYLGGGAADAGGAIAVDGAGNAVITGSTKSTNFPVLSALQATHAADNGAEDAFVARLNAAGALQSSTYLGGSGVDTGTAIDLDRSGNTYVAGATASANFPSASALDTSIGGTRDGFLTRLTPAGTAMVFSTFFGGAGSDQINAMSIDRAPGHAGGIYLTGETTSTDFPTAGAVQTALNGGADAFVAVLNPVASAPYVNLHFGTYLGSANADAGHGIAVDSDGNAVVVGATLGTSSAPFPTVKAWQPKPAGATDGFIAKIALGSTPTVSYSTYFGGSADDRLEDVAVDEFGTAYVIGTTNSTNVFGTSPYFGLQSTNGGGYDAMTARYSDEGELFWASYLGGGGTDQGSAVALYGSSTIFVGGVTGSTNLATNVPFKSSNSGGADAFITRYGIRSLRTNARNFNADKTDDILWRNATTGDNMIWRSASSTAVTAVAPQNVAQWKVAGTGDFDADGHADILWRNTGTGANVLWKGGVATSAASLLTVADQNWQVAGIGDFNLDGRSDIFWRNGQTGANVIWLSGDSTTTQTMRAAGTNWTVAGIGDFDGDFASDVFWRDNVRGSNVIWMSANSSTSRVATAVTDLAWKVVGVGDFLGDGKSDVLWRNANTGVVTMWRGADYASQPPAAAVGPDFDLAAVGDYTGDGRSDILWRNKNTGTNVMWRSGNPNYRVTIGAQTNQAWKVVP